MVQCDQMVRRDLYSLSLGFLVLVSNEFFALLVAPAPFEGSDEPPSSYRAMPKPRSRSSSDARRRPSVPRDSTTVVKRMTTFPTHACWSEILKRADGKDRVVGLLQYVAMVISGGRPGSVLTSIGFVLNDARRPFRLYTPVAVLIDTFLTKGARARPPATRIPKSLFPRVLYPIRADHPWFAHRPRR